MKNKTLLTILVTAFLPALDSQTLAADLMPLLKGQFNFSGYAVTVAVTGNYAYLAGDTAGLRILSLADPVQPKEVGHFFTGPSVDLVAVAGNRAYVAGDDSSFFVIDIAEPSHPQPLGSLGTGGAPRSIVLSGNLAFVADYNSGLNVIDITDSTAPQLVGRYAPSDGNAVGVAISSNRAYVAVARSGVHALDISNPATPNLLGIYPLGTTVRGVAAAAANLVYAVDYNNGLLVIDFTDPSHPQLLGKAALPGWGFSVTLWDHYAFVTLLNGDTQLYQQGLQIFDISNPSNPGPAGGVLTTPSDPRGVTVVGNLAYLCAGNLRIFQLTGLPAFTSQTLVQGKLRLAWNEVALGMKLQTASTLTQPNWQEVPGSENFNSILLPPTDATGFFRLVK